MRKILALSTASIALLLPLLNTHAQGLEEIVVSASRVSSYEDDTVPVIHLVRRADFMVVSAYIESDSRNRTLREKEVTETLASLQQLAQREAKIELGLIKEFETNEETLKYVIPFELDNVNLSAGYRPDTSRVGLVIKSPIAKADESPEVVYERIEAFMDSVDTSGRAIVGDDEEPSLSVVNIAQYRDTLLRRLAADNAKVREIFGSDFQVAIAGLEEPVRWRIVGPMQLAVYFPYFSSIQAN